MDWKELKNSQNTSVLGAQLLLDQLIATAHGFPIPKHVNTFQKM